MNEKDELRPEYDLSKLKFVGQGIYAKRYAEDANNVFPDSGVVEEFTDSRTVDEEFFYVLLREEFAKYEEMGIL